MNTAIKLASSLVAEIWQQRRDIVRRLLISVGLMLPFLVGYFSDLRQTLVVAALYLVLAHSLLGFLSRIAFVVTSSLWIFATLVAMHLKRHWGFGQLSSRVEAFYESPSGEIVEYLRSHVDAVDVVSAIVAILVVIVVIRFTPRIRSHDTNLRLTAAILLVLWLAAPLALQIDLRLRRLPPIELSQNSIDARLRYQQLARRADNLKHLGAETQDCNLRYNTIVIVLGESASTDHMSAFGYALPTTPFADGSNPHKFKALSPANQTRYSLAMMLTKATPDQFEMFFTSRSLVGELRGCGYRTLWISNQGRRGEYDSFSTSLAMEADEQIFLNDWSWTNVTYDGRIVEELESRNDLLRPRQAVFVHVMGSHTEYSERYPPGFGFAEVSDTVAQYDNSILYTDHILERLYGRFKSESTLFVYASDHGQVVSNDMFGSGFLPGYQEEYRTPLMIWTADSTSIARVREEIGDKMLNLESFDDLLRYLVGMSPVLELSTRKVVTVLSPEHVKDYDTLPSFREALGEPDSAYRP